MSKVFTAGNRVDTQQMAVIVMLNVYKQNAKFTSAPLKLLKKDFLEKLWIISHSRWL